VACSPAKHPEATSCSVALVIFRALSCSCLASGNNFLCSLSNNSALDVESPKFRVVSASQIQQSVVLPSWWVLANNSLLSRTASSSSRRSAARMANARHCSSCVFLLLKVASRICLFRCNLSIQPCTCEMARFTELRIRSGRESSVPSAPSSFSFPKSVLPAWRAPISDSNSALLKSCIMLRKLLTASISIGTTLSVHEASSSSILWKNSSALVWYWTFRSRISFLNSRRELMSFQARPRDSAMAA
jgi:hypothetical protein